MGYQGYQGPAPIPPYGRIAHGYQAMWTGHNNLHGVKEWRPPMIWDCFMFINEHELAEIRFKHMKDYVDRFVVVEGSRTHSGRPRDFGFDPKAYPDVADRIVYIQAVLPDDASRWLIENVQRDLILQGLSGASPDDIALVSDCDEMPSHAALEKLKGAALPLAFQMQTCGWYVNMVDPAVPWVGTVATTVDQIRSLTPQHFRRQRFGYPKIHGGGFHFTFMGGLEKVAYKIGAFAHAEFDTDENKDVAILAARRDRCIDPMGTGKFNGRELDLADPDFPPYLKENKNKYPEFFKTWA